jgi:hypothetical protein
MSPRWLEALLIRFLGPKDRDSVPGDLLEEYRDAVDAGTSRLRATYWYARQVLSILAIHLLTARNLLFVTCLLSMFAAAVLAYISNAPEATPLAIAFAASAGLTISLLTRPRTFQIS